MEIANRYGCKPIHHRLGPRRPTASSVAGHRYNKVCNYWKAGRCNRNPCPYLHCELPQSLDAGTSIKKRALVWRNPNPNAKKSDPPCQNASDAGKRDSDLPKLGTGDGQMNRKLCKYFTAGERCDLGDNCKFLHSWFTGDGFSLLTSLQGHQKVITGITLPSGSGKLYTGSQDKTVRVWDCNTGQCIHTATSESEVECVISDGPWIFAGIHNAVQAWNSETLAGVNLTVTDCEFPIGRVYALAFYNEMLFAATQNGRIMVWKLNAEKTSFEAAASLEGHESAVVSLVVGAGRLYSGSMDTTIRIWDLATLQCIETLTGHASIVMSLLCWDQFLISCSLDQTVKVWGFNESGEKIEVQYTRTEEHGVLKLYGIQDTQEKPVLLCACNDDTVRLYDLPTFRERGRIFSKQEVRAIAIGPEGLFFTGDATGELKVWKWAAKDVAVASH